MAAVGPVVLRIAGAEDADPALLGAIVRALGLKAGEIAWTKPARAAPAGADSRDAGPRLPLLAFGTAPSAGVNLPPVAELRADPVAKRQAWRTLRALAKSLKVR
jgi:hypothetical protein